MINNIKSDLIIEEARSWLGTRFHHQARVKKSSTGSGGCDCIGLIIGVAEKLNLKSKENINLKSFDYTTYPKLPLGNRLKEELDRHFELSSKDNMQVGSVVLFDFGRGPQHVGIISGVNPYKIIHAYIQARKVVEHNLDNQWYEKIIAVYKFS